MRAKAWELHSESSVYWDLGRFSELLEMNSIEVDQQAELIEQALRIR